MSDCFPDSLQPGIRQVVTAVDDRGRAIVLSDTLRTGDPRALMLWGTDAAPMMGDATPSSVEGWWPPPGGVRISLSTRKPDRLEPSIPPPTQAWPDINDAAGFHASASADIIIIISGRIWLELDDGVEVELRAGDTLVQNGTRHRWHNHGDTWPIMAVVIVGARQATKIGEERIDPS